MKKSDKSANGTSYHGVNIITTPNQLIRILGEPSYMDNTGMDKTNFDWICETDNGDVFTIYDWKEYAPLKYDVTYTFHIGGDNEKICQTAKFELQRALRLLVPSDVNNKK